jgi:hypothetical protein
MRYFHEKARKTRVLDEVDVVVAGGGPSGVAAAIAASRLGARVILVERGAFLGGLATGGLLSEMVETHRYGFGICREVIDKLERLDAAKMQAPPSRAQVEWTEGAAMSGEAVVWYDPEMFKFVADELTLEANVEILFYSLVVGAIVEEETINGIIIENKNGRQVLLGKVVIDGTGDADVAACCGVQTLKHRHPWGVDLGFRLGGVDEAKAAKWKREHLREFREINQKLTSGIGKFKWDKTIRNDIVSGDGARVTHADGMSVYDQTKVTVETRRGILKLLDFLRTYVPGFENAYLIDTASLLGVRETRKTVGEYTLSKEDVLERKEFDDVCARGLFDIPYRCLIPKGIEGLLVCGRCISVSHEAHGNIRNIPVCFATGQAAGTAAALSVQHRRHPRELDVKELQHSLLQQGVCLGDEERVLALELV